METCDDFGVNRIPIQYTVNYKSIKENGNEMNVIINDSSTFPPTTLILDNENGIFDNTKYEISIMTTTRIRDDGRTVHSDFTAKHYGITGNSYFTSK